MTRLIPLPRPEDPAKIPECDLAEIRRLSSNELESEYKLWGYVHHSC